jgi:hypothetical protein
MKVRDPKKYSIPEEIAKLHANQFLYDKLTQIKYKQKKLKSDDPFLFIDITINPIILEKK